LSHWELLLPLPSAQQLNWQLKERSVVGLGHLLVGALVLLQVQQQASVQYPLPHRHRRRLERLLLGGGLSWGLVLVQVQ
jgi:hypothetical protein